MSSVAQLSLPRSIPRGPVTGLVLRAWHGEIATGEARDRAATRWRLLIALGTQALVIGLCALIANLFRDAQQGRTGALLAGALVGVVVCVIGLVIAWFVSSDPQAEQAACIADRGCHSHQDLDDWAAGFVLSILIDIALVGGLGLLRALRRIRLEARLLGVDRMEAARVLAVVGASAAGAPWSTLPKHGQPTDSLRRTVAFLVLRGWVDVYAADHVLRLRAPALRGAPKE